MPDAHPVTDAEILAGFKSLHDAISFGFAGVKVRFDSTDARFAALEQRLMRRFDSIDARFNAVEVRLAALEHKRG
jgi:hypothetical protein